MEKLPGRHLKGIWVLGFEYSVFYENRMQPAPVPTFEPPSNAEVWLDADSELLTPYAIPDDGRTRQYFVEFIGAKSQAPGYYGHFGQYKKGAMIFKMIALREIPVKSETHNG
jgi:hypothetical protein